MRGRCGRAESGTSSVVFVDKDEDVHVALTAPTYLTSSIKHHFFFMYVSLEAERCQASSSNKKHAPLRSTNERDRREM